MLFSSSSTLTAAHVPTTVSSSSSHVDVKMSRRAILAMRRGGCIRDDGSQTAQVIDIRNE